MRKHAPFVGPIALALAFLFLGQAARAQDLFLPPPPPDGTSRAHMAPTGKACVKVDKSVKAETLNPDIFQHWITATNSCGELIRMKVCYYQTQDCISVTVPPWGHQAAILGIFPALNTFRYSYTEQF
jgi:hypothetical protein